MTYQYDFNDNPELITIDFINGNLKLPLEVISVNKTSGENEHKVNSSIDLSVKSMHSDDEYYEIKIKHDYQAVYGLGERFNRINQKGLTVSAEVIEKFCNQGDNSYCPIPVFFTDNGLGIYIDTLTVTEYQFEEEITVRFGRDSKHRWPVVYFFTGTPKEILSAYSDITGKPRITPKWSFGPWMSANRWNTQAEIERQLDLLEESGIPQSAMVIEAWSDEATFYQFNEHEEWINPKEMIQKLEEIGIRLILWQIPVIKKMDHGMHHAVLDADWAYAVEQELCIQNQDGTPYTIPSDHWFAGSLLPDFTNPKTVEWWFGKRQYLLDLGVAGFKTDGGEFILRDDIETYNGLTGIEMRNGYALEYVKAYSQFIGKDRVLFSRAGYSGQQCYPMQWAGDQVSTWEELQHVLTAGISIGLSGVPLWGFDIAGFAGPMPSSELYVRATQLAVFTPVMQWHSEPSSGQFSELMANTVPNNDRSPWNMSDYYQDQELLNRVRIQYYLRMNLLPYLYQQAVRSSETGLPMMKHLIVEYPQDKKVCDIEDEFMLGDLLIAPILKADCTERIVYLPMGYWSGLWTMSATCLNQDMEAMISDHDTTGGGQCEDDSPIVNSCMGLKGGHYYKIQCGKDHIPVLIREGGCIALNLGADLQLCSDVKNQTKGYTNLCFYITGEQGSYQFSDDEGNEISLNWEHGTCHAEQIQGSIRYTILDDLS